MAVELPDFMTEMVGNGRRESDAHVPMPRMTNTHMLAGDKDPA
jgi:TldD protein